MADNLRLGPVDFFSADNQVLLNPRMPVEKAGVLKSWLTAATSLKAHVFILTSGSTAVSEADFKWVALSKPAILAAASGSNAHLQCNSDDVWLHCLPDFHVGGIGIWARAFLAQSKVSVLDSQGGWNANRYVDAASRAGATLSSLVPAQIHDIVTAHLKAPETLRAILVGGGVLSDDQYAAARDLGWPLLRTYGMSETASQIATETLEKIQSKLQQMEATYRVLPHLEAKHTSEGRISVRGPSLFTGYVSLDHRGKPHMWNPKDRNGWFLTEDFGRVEDGSLQMQGRTKDRIKIGGEIANLELLRRNLDVLLTGTPHRDQVVLLAIPDPRLESVIAIVSTSRVEPGVVESLTLKFNQAVMPFERIRDHFVVSEIPRTELLKVKWAELLALLPSR